jgi:hypothetical protein
MRSSIQAAVVLVGVCLTFAGPALCEPIADSTWTDHDARPIPRPRDWEPDFYGHLFREAIVEPLSHAFDVPDKVLGVVGALGAHPRREAVDVNAFDEVPNSTWFTNRNHLRAVPVSELEQGPDSTLLPAKPWRIEHPKKGGASAGFQIKDAAGFKWLIKLDWHGYPQASSGADMVARTLVHAAGYNVPHNEPVRFRREDLVIDEKLAHGGKAERFTEADLDTVLARGARTPEGEYWAIASLFLPGHPLGAASIDRRRPGDRNDWYSHPQRREMRGFYVLCSWLGYWDTKDSNLLDMFDSTATGQGYVEHYILDVGSSFGANADGVKRPKDGYEGAMDLGWTARRLVTLGFIEEPWRRARQETGIPSIGRFESEVFSPGKFVPEVPSPAFRAMTDRDAYWGAKIVASFSDAQIRAAVDAARYEDPRAREFLVRNLIERRDKIARYWFGRVAPLDFFAAENGAVRFHDLALDMGLTPARRYDVEIERGGRGHVLLSSPDLPLRSLGTATSRIELEISVEGSRAKPAHVELTRRGAEWAVTRVRHG